MHCCSHKSEDVGFQHVQKKFPGVLWESMIWIDVILLCLLFDAVNNYIHITYTVYMYIYIWYMYTLIILHFSTGSVKRLEWFIVRSQQYHLDTSPTILQPIRAPCLSHSGGKSHIIHMSQRRYRKVTSGSGKSHQGRRITMAQTVSSIMIPISISKSGRSNSMTDNRYFAEKVHICGGSQQNHWKTADTHTISSDSNPIGTAPIWHTQPYNLWKRVPWHSLFHLYLGI